MEGNGKQKRKGINKWKEIGKEKRKKIKERYYGLFILSTYEGTVLPNRSLIKTDSTRLVKPTKS
jgi:hypothetical protein